MSENKEMAKLVCPFCGAFYEASSVDSLIVTAEGHLWHSEKHNNFKCKYMIIIDYRRNPELYREFAVYRSNERTTILIKLKIMEG